MSKFVITTVQVVTRKYYVNVRDPVWAHDGIVMEEMEDFSQQFGSEDIVDTRGVEEFPVADKYESVNGAVMSFNYEQDKWDRSVRWDLAKNV